MRFLSDVRLMASRRALIGGLVLGASALAVRALADDAPRKKASKVEAHYQDKPQGIQSCSLCSLFAAPNACKIVEGKVSPDGWCQLFTMVD